LGKDGITLDLSQHFILNLGMDEYRASDYPSSIIIIYIIGIFDKTGTAK